MKFRAPRPALATAVKTAATVAGRSHLPILNGVRLDVERSQVTATCSDIDLTIRARAEAGDATKGSVVVPAAHLSRFLSVCDDATAVFTTTKDGLRVECGDATIRLPVLPVDEWPAHPEVSGETVDLSPFVLDQMRKVVGYASADRSLPQISAVHLEGSQVSATDRYRLARAELGMDVGGRVLVPADALKAVLREADETLSLVADARLARFTAGTVEWTTRLVEAEPLPVDRLMRTKHDHALTVDVARMAEAVKRVRILADRDDSEGVVLAVDGGKLVVRNSVTELGELVDVVPCEGSMPGSVVLRSSFLADVLDNADGDSITFGFGDTAMSYVQVDGDGLVEVLAAIRPPAT